MKLLGLTLKLAMVQLSDVPLFTSAAVIVALPDASRLTVIFFVITVGGVTSFTVTVAGALAELPLESVAVNVTGSGPHWRR